MPDPLSFQIQTKCRSTHARIGIAETQHGSFETPAFMPIGTRGSVKGILPCQLADVGSQIILSNAYHLMLRPGDELIAQLGGLHTFMNWNGPILTDSGGYQAFSMSDINAVDDDGVTFRSVYDGAEIRLTPERSIEVQNNLGPDIIMAFDDCPPSIDPKQADASRDHADRIHIAHERTARWLRRCVAAHARPDDQALFGIVQGGLDLELRSASIEAICNVDLPGYAVGGVAVGEGPDEIRRIVQFTAPLLPEDRPRYLMGVGYERDMLVAIQSGIDMFDCVLPTRNGRNANAFTPRGPMHLRNATYKDDPKPIDTACDCPACRSGFSRAYVRHLFAVKEMLGPILVSLHNIRHFQRLLLDIKRAIRDDGWSLLEQAWPVLSAARTPESPAEESA